MENLRLRIALDAYYREVSRVIVDKQHPVTGLLPASTAVNTHGDYRDAWVRDNVYSILAVWGLGMAYRSLDDDDGRGRELERRTVLLMRALLRSMMAQASKVETFKKTRDPKDSLHAKYDTETGATVVRDDAWGHLQIDATSVFLLQLAQMTASGLEIIWTMEEVHFVQNLVYYIERAYRTPDFGIWERGAKSNHGRVELNASSVGMAKAALEALDCFNLFGARGGHASVIHVSPDNIAQSDITLSEMLPRESHSKEVDAAVLSVIGYPAFAVHDEKLKTKTRRAITKKLEGRYGLKRFLRDGHQTAVEDDGRLHYEAEELKQFENVESEWPLFFTYLYLDALIRHDENEALKYERLLDDVVVEQGGERLLPELYYVPRQSIAAEREEPGSQERLPNENVPLVWAQSLYILARMLREGVLSPSQIDPLGRRRHKRAGRPVVQVLLLSEDEELQAELAAHGVQTETLEELAPVQAYVPEEIARAHGAVGKDARLGLSGRAARALKSLTTSRFYDLNGKTALCLAPFFSQGDFYLTYDLEFLVERFKSELMYLRRHWTMPGRPTVTILLTRNLLGADRTPLFQLMSDVRRGQVGGVPVRQGSLVQLLATGSFERLDLSQLDEPLIPVNPASLDTHALRSPQSSAPLNVQAEREIESTEDIDSLVRRLSETANLYEQVEVLSVLASRGGLDQVVRVGDKSVPLFELVSEVYYAAGAARHWSVIRRAAGILGKVDVDLNLACAALLVAHKNIQVGRAYSPESLITAPLPDHELLEKIEKFCRDDAADRVLTQEILLYLGLLVRARPKLFRALLTVRVSHIIGLITGELARETNLPIDEAYSLLLKTPPSEVQARLEAALSRYAEIESLPQDLEHLSIAADLGELHWNDDLGLSALPEPPEGWHAWRQFRGVIDRRPPDFYSRTWYAFKHVPGFVIGDKLDRRNRIDSRIVLSDMTPGEQSFALLLEHQLNKIQAPEFRQLNVEALTVVTSFFAQNPELLITDVLSLDALIGHAVRLHYLHHHPEHATVYDSFKVEAWNYFYASAPVDTSSAIASALRFLLTAPEEAPLRQAEAG